jgi:hypothetical protein
MKSAPQSAIMAMRPARVRAAASQLACVCVAAVLISHPLAPYLRAAQAQSSAYTTWSVTIVLPPRVMAGHPATLAVFGVDGKLAAGVTVTIDDGQTVTTDRTGRATFNAPPARDYMLAKASGASAAALVDPATGASEPVATTVQPVISLRDRFWICSAGLRGDADADGVWINDQPALVLAASPECLVAIPGSKAEPGPATLRIDAPGTTVSAKSTLVDLSFDAPDPAPLPGKKSRLAVRVRGTDERLGLVVDNLTPNVLKFAAGDSQEVLTRGGEPNVATIEVRAVRSGDFSFRARLIPPPDTSIAWRYLWAAAVLAPQDRQSDVRELAKRTSRKPKDVPIVRAEVEKMVGQTIDSDFRTLLSAAWSAL